MGVGPELTNKGDSQMAQIAPSILSADFTKLGEEIVSLRKIGVKVVHVDVMDANFVPNLTFGYTMVKALSKYKENMKFDVHLMMEHPFAYIEKFVEAGADMLTVHEECADDVIACLDKIAALGAVPGISLKPDTPAEAVLPYIGKFKQCLIMTVEPGFGGQTMMYDCLDKMAAVRALCPDKALIMSVDGGVTEENVKLVKEKGADLIVAGSAVFAPKNRKKAFKALQSLVD